MSHIVNPFLTPQLLLPCKSYKTKSAATDTSDLCRHVAAQAQLTWQENNI